MPSKIFLEQYPLYKKFKMDIKPLVSGMYGSIGTTLDQIPKPAINMYCDLCISLQTFNMVNNYWDDDKLGYLSTGPVGYVFRLKYLCAGCKHKLALFYVEFGQTIKKVNKKELISYWIRKVGQNPPWEIDIDKNLETLLGEYKDVYKKGLVNESQGYGIGAYSYYRRITEEIIDELLGKIYPLIEGEVNKEKYKEALQNVKKTRITEEKINLVRELLPNSLRPGGLNPLSILHNALSAGIHGKSDEECLKLAEDVRKVLIYLVNEVLNHQKVSVEFTESMRKLLEDKNKK